MKHYFIYGGFRDGRAGFVNAVLISFYKFIAVAKDWEFRMEKKENDLNRFIGRFE